MFSKVVVLLVCLSVVKATVFTFNGYEDENNEIDNLSEDAVARSARTCVSSQCHRVCRRLGHVHGFCVSPNVCRCRGRLGRSAAFDAEEVSDPEVAEISNVADESAIRSLRSCGYAECNAFCRKLGYARGVCIGTYCQCRMRSAAADAVEIPKPDTEAAVKTESRSVRNCNIKECNEYCRKRGFVCGVCIDAYCQCRIFLANKPLTEISYVADIADDTNVRICQLSECNWYCRKRGYTWGVCIGETHCQYCMTIADKSSRLTSEEIPEALALKSCSLQACEQSCRRIGFPGGACVNGHCKCDILRSASPLSESDFESDEIAEPSSKALRFCNLRECAQSCRRNGFRGGVCVNGRCKCNIRRSALPVSALTASGDNNDEIAMDANPEDDAPAGGDESSENSVY